MRKLRQMAEQPADKSQNSILPNRTYLRAGGLNHLSQGER